MARPPQHRADAPISFFSSKAREWDNARINTELRALEGEALADHIVGAYLRGETRGDLYAKDSEGRTVLDYITIGADGVDGIPLRRLSILDVARFRDAAGRAGQLGAARAAYDGDIEALADQHGADFVFELGEFALRCSEAPRPGEPKRSGS